MKYIAVVTLGRKAIQAFDGRSPGGRCDRRAKSVDPRLGSPNHEWRGILPPCPRVATMASAMAVPAVVSAAAAPIPAESPNPDPAAVKASPTKAKVSMAST
jgi:hypothetical protein